MSKILIADLMQDSGVGFGTSGARGLVADMTDRVCYAYASAFLQYLSPQLDYQNPRVAIAGDLRPSTTRILFAVSQAASDMSIEPLNCGLIPSPAVALFGIQHKIPSVMFTGSHIPDDRNGIKFNTALGEISKDDETGLRANNIEINEELFDSTVIFRQDATLPQQDK